MANTNRTRYAARRALAAYRSVPGMDPGDHLDAITDLVADLAHLADRWSPAPPPGRQVPGARALRVATDHYLAELSGD